MDIGQLLGMYISETVFIPAKNFFKLLLEKKLQPLENTFSISDYRSVFGELILFINL